MTKANTHTYIYIYICLCVWYIYIYITMDIFWWSHGFLFVVISCFSCLPSQGQISHVDFFWGGVAHQCPRPDLERRGCRLRSDRTNLWKPLNHKVSQSRVMSCICMCVYIYMCVCVSVYMSEKDRIIPNSSKHLLTVYFGMELGSRELHRGYVEHWGSWKPLETLATC